MCRSMRSPRRGSASRRWAKPRPRRRSRACLRGLAGRTGRLLEQSRALSPLTADARLAMEISVIQTLAERLIEVLLTRDPLSERVHLSKPAMLRDRRARRRAWPAAASVRAARRVRRRRGGDAMTRSRQRPGAGRQPRQGQLVLYGDAHPAARAARGDVRGLFVLPGGRRHRRWRRAAAVAAGAARRTGASASPRSMPASVPAGLAGARPRHRAIFAAPGGLPRRDRRHGDGRREDIRAPSFERARSLLRPRRQRGRPAVGARLRA